MARGRPRTLVLGGKCGRGHKLTVDTLYVSPSGRSACRVCRKADEKVSKARRATTHTRSKGHGPDEMTGARGSENMSDDAPIVITVEDYRQVREWIRTGYVKTLLKNRIGMSFREFAECVSLPHASVTRWLNGYTAMPEYKDDRSLPIVFQLQWLDELADYDDKLLRTCGYATGVMGDRVHAKDIKAGRHECPPPAPRDSTHPTD